VQRIGLVFTVTIFLSAALLFFVQPLFAKLVLPQIGGAPAVWTTAMLFFQSVLIAGYAYAHLMARYLPHRAQLAVHLVLFGLALTFLPLAIPENWTYDGTASPAGQTLVLFALGVGVPFAFLSANAPLLQSWYAKSGRPDAHDPYYLYGASNLGSLIALLGFPLAAEPLFGASAISRGWALGFVVLGVAIAASGLMISPKVGAPSESHASKRPDLATMLKWALLAFVPSSLMLAVTTRLSTDLGAVPLLWVVPLALYLLTFVLVFRAISPTFTRLVQASGALGLIVLLSLFISASRGHLPLAAAVIFVVGFFAVALLFHRALYDARPHGADLTLFYLVMSLGGAMGGLFNSILAPVVFDDLHEGFMTVVIGAAVVLAPRLSAGRIGQGWVLAASVLALAAVSVLPHVSLVNSPDMRMFALAGIAAVTAASLIKAPMAAVAVATIAVLAGVLQFPNDRIFRDRSFFGTHQVVDQEDLRFYANGTTIHGAERIVDLSAERPLPMFYYHPNGPLGQILQSEIGQRAESVGVIGLGIGGLACHSRPGQKWEFYEIDPMVDRIARDPALFTFMSACAPDAPTHLGDARIVLAGQQRQYDLLVIDAFSSDAVPVHLLTREAMELYLDRVGPNGVVAYHISTRYYPLQAAVARIAASLGVPALDQYYPGHFEKDPGDTPSRVVIVARSAEALAALASDPRWKALPIDDTNAWTDDYANLLGLLFERN
jgi:hypothetical protein